jgi:inhibitor of cysteine peptidase
MENQITLSTIDTKIGDTFQINLTSNPSTGYSWKIEKLDQSILKFIKEDFLPCAYSAEGTSTTQSLEFKALKAGSSIIELSYEQSWDTSDAQVKAFRIDID